MNCWVLIMLGVITFQACGEFGEKETTDKPIVQVPAPEDNKGCTTEQFSDHVTIKCGDYDAVVVYNGNDGQDGKDGTDGQDGDVGPKGEDGADGAPGEDGVDGSSCTVSIIDPSSSVPAGGAAIRCGLDTVVVVNGGSAYSVVENIDPCGPSGNHDEIFQRLANGEVVSLFVESGDARTARLAYLQDGISYKTTDDQECKFSLSTSDGVRTLTTTSPVSSYHSWNMIPN